MRWPVLRRRGRSSRPGRSAGDVPQHVGPLRRRRTAPDAEGLGNPQRVLEALLAHRACAAHHAGGLGLLATLALVKVLVIREELLDGPGAAATLLLPLVRGVGRAGKS